MAGGPGRPKKFTYYPVNTVPTPGTIVWCRWPFEDDPDEFKERPALVRAVLLSKDHTKAMVEVVYGTSKLKQDERFFDLIIMNLTEMLEAGLPKATRFDLDKCQTLPWAEELFVCRDGNKTPASGHLTQSAQEQLREVLEIRRKMGRSPISR